MKSSPQLKTVLSLQLLTVWLQAATAANVIYVDKGATGANNGTEWHNAYVSLEEALEKAKQGDEIRVAEGVYRPDPSGLADPRAATFHLVDGVSIYGGFPAGGGEMATRDPNSHLTILSGDLSDNDVSLGDSLQLGGDLKRSDNAYRVVTARALGGRTSLEGLVIKGGNANDPNTVQNGGGLYTSAHALVVSNCRFVENYACYGGAVRCVDGGLTIANCEFQHNGARNSGGGIYVNSGIFRMSRCCFRDSSATWGGAMAIFDAHDMEIADCNFCYNVADANGGSVYSRASHFKIEDCNFVANRAADEGGAISLCDAMGAEITHCDLRGNTAGSNGGGVYGVRGDFRLDTCTFGENSAGCGGALFNRSGCSPVTAACVFTRNKASVAGGAIYNYESSSPDIVRCCFLGNEAEATRGCGGAIVNKHQSSPRISDCVFVGKNVAAFGGAVASLNECAPGLFNCRFLGNKASWGGAIYANDDCDITGVNCVFSGNLAVQTGAAIMDWDDSRMLFVNCVFVANSAPKTRHAAVAGTGSDPNVPVVLTNCILWDNGEHPLAEAGMTVTYSCVQYGCAGEGNIRDNPGFVDADGLDNLPGTEDDDLRLCLSSPCLDAGNSEALMDVLAQRPPPSAIGADLDAGGNRRFADEPSIPDTGRGTAPVVDMGAYEGGLACLGLQVSSPAIQINEGGTRAFTVWLGHVPPERIEVTVAWQRGDPDISVISGRSLFFDASNFSEAQTVVLSAAQDSDFQNGQATIAVTIPDLVSLGVVVSEQDDEPASAMLYVDSRAAGANNGSSWDDAFTDLQQCLAVARSRARSGPLLVLVAGGTYTPAGPEGDHDATFELCSGVGLYGGYAGLSGRNPNERDVSAFETVLSGDLLDNDEPNFVNYTENVNHVVTAHYLDESMVLDGFTIRGGKAAHRGGGIESLHSNLRIVNCTFKANKAWKGGGMSCEYGAPILINCTFLGNAVGEGYGGGALANKDSALQAINCRFFDNSAAYGGAVHSRQHKAPLFTNCVFRGNRARLGGVLFADDCSPTMVNCTLMGNAATDPNGGSAVCAWAVEGDAPSYVKFQNCILWDEGVEVSHGDESSFAVTFCDVQSKWRWPGEGNTNVDPLLTSDGHLLPGSPCIDAGSSNLDFLAAEPGYIQELLGVDADFHVRRHDTNAATLKGDVAPVVDMGAYEFGSEPVPSVLYVSANAKGGGVGRSWSSAFPTLQTALQTALVAGERVREVWVAKGTYRPAPPGGSRGATFRMPEGLAIYGGFAGDEEARELRDPRVHETVLSGDLSVNDHSGSADWTDNSYHVITAVGVTLGAVLDGFLIRDGNASEPNGVNSRGGGMYVETAAPTIANCTIVDNSAATCGGGIFSLYSMPRLIDCTIRDNQREGMWLENSNVDIDGDVHLIADEWTCSNAVLGGAGTLWLTSDSLLAFDDSRVRCSVEGPGTMQVSAGSELIIEANAVIDLGQDGQGRGRIICDGLLRMKDEAKLRNVDLRVKRAQFENHVVVSNSVITAEAGAPFGQFFIQDTVCVEDNDIHADGDRYMDLDPATFQGILRNNRIYITITEGQNNTLGGLLELRGLDLHGGQFAPDQFLCRLATIPEFSTLTWTIEQLELAPGAKVNLTNRFTFGNGGPAEVMYVKKLILGDGSVLNTAFNRMYYGQLEESAHAAIVNVPILGLSLNNIAFDNPDDFASRVIHNNLDAHSQYDRIHVDLVCQDPDPKGMMRMRNLKDIDPTSPTYGDVIQARAKGLFGKASEAEVIVQFEYLFRTPGGELVIYLSNVPEMLSHQDPARDDHYLEVGRVKCPPPGWPGAPDSGRFGSFQSIVSVGHLDFLCGTRMELELIGPVETEVWINNWDPGIRCVATKCGDVAGKGHGDVDVWDFMAVLTEVGNLIADVHDIDANDPCTPAYCLDCYFSQDGVVTLEDALAIEWAIAGAGFPCRFGSTPSAANVTGVSSDLRMAEDPSAELAGPLVVAGKGYGSVKENCTDDYLYSFAKDGVQTGGPAAIRDSKFMCKIVRDPNATICQLDMERGLQQAGRSIVPPGDYWCGLDLVYIGRYFDTEPSDLYSEWSLPLQDAAFDQEGNVYVVPVVVNSPDGGKYRAAAKLAQDHPGDPTYHVVQLYNIASWTEPEHGLHEIKVDGAGWVYVLRSCPSNAFAGLYVFDRASGDPKPGSPFRLDDIADAPTCLHVSDTTGNLYFSSARNEPNATMTQLYVVDRNRPDVLKETVSIDDLGHITGITEDPGTGTIWAVGFTIDHIPTEAEVSDNFSSTACFYRPYLTRVERIDQTPSAIEHADHVLSATTVPLNLDWMLPVSIVWTGGS